jgi:hypothetical protein
MTGAYPRHVLLTAPTGLGEFRRLAALSLGDSCNRLARTRSLVDKDRFEKPTQMLDDHLKLRRCELVSGYEGPPLCLLGQVLRELV